MKVFKKVQAAFDKRQIEYINMIKKRDGDPKQRDRMENGGYKCPGSRNPRKARFG